MRIIDRDQAMVVGGFGSVNRTNARLLALTRAGFLRRFFLGSGGGRKAIYALSPKGAEQAGAPLRGPRRPQAAILVADNFVQHQLTVNGIYCSLKYRTTPPQKVTFHQWAGFSQSITPNLSLIPDGYVEFKTDAGIRGCFLEVDLGHESLVVWKEKARHYVAFALSGAYKEQFGEERFRVLVIAPSDRRLQSIRMAVGEVTDKIFRFAMLASVRPGFFEPIWCRPKDEIKKSLFENTQ
jgi:hypothetical protein